MIVVGLYTTTNITYNIPCHLFVKLGVTVKRAELGIGIGIGIFLRRWGRLRNCPDCVRSYHWHHQDEIGAGISISLSPDWNHN